MNPPQLTPTPVPDTALSAAARYTSTLRNSRKSRLPAGFVEPKPPSFWPEENVALLERYQQWLADDGAGEICIAQYYIPMAGHVLGYHLKHHNQLDLNANLERAMIYVYAKRPSQRWIRLCRMGLDRFRRFLREERGLTPTLVSFSMVNVDHYHAGLPTWLIEQLTRYQHLRQANWRPSRLGEAIKQFWDKHTRLWRWLFQQEEITELSHIRRQHLFLYIDERLAAGYNPKSVNQDLRAFQATLRFLQSRAFAIPRALLTLPGLKEPDALPRFLPDEQVNQLRADLEQRVNEASTPSRRRNALLDRAAFYLMWQGGLRLGEVEELCLSDLNLPQKHLMVRKGKGQQDRAVYLTDAAITAVQAYLAVRGNGPTEHFFLYRHGPLSKDFIRGRLKAAGERTGVKVTPHRLRHTFATQLLNAGCRVTTIQVLLGHQHLNTTMTYARIHDQTVADDYFTAMTLIEQRLEVDKSGQPKLTTTLDKTEPHQNGTANGHLLSLVEALAVNTLNDDQRELVAELRSGILALAGETDERPGISC